MENKINIACFKEGSRTAEIKGIWQWDYGQILRIQGLSLPTAVEIHFSLDDHGGEAARRIGVTKDGVTDVPIPDSIVENESAYGDSYYFFAYIYLTDETSGNTEYKIRAKVSTRSKPEGFVSGGNDTFAEILKTVNEIAEDKVDIPASAKVGQVLSVKATDESGKPTEFEATDQVGGVSDEKIAEAVGTYMKEHPLDESDPTVPDWAKQPEKPSYTASEVGADAAGTAENKVSAHNTSGDAHNDIRLLVQGLIERLDALADSDDETLDQMSEVVAYIKSNKALIDAITTGKVSVSDIVDNLTTNVSNKPLSAAQGVKLKALIDAIVVPTKLSELENDSGYAKNTDIPDKLPNPQKLTFAGAVTAEYNGSGAVTVTIPESSGGTGLSTEAIDKLEEVGNYLVYTTADGGSKWTELIDILRNGSSGGGSGETVTLQSISATYTGGEVTTGTALSDLTGIIVTATYSDGTTKTVTGYTLSGEILEGENIITVSYGGKTTTFTVTGIVESGGGEVTAELPTDGLVGYFDFRTCEYNNAGSGGSTLTLIQPTQGNGQLFAWSNNAVNEQNEYGMKMARNLFFDGNGGTTQSECGESFTWVFKCYLTNVSSPMFALDYGSLSNNRKINYKPKYNTASSTGQVAQEGFGNRLVDDYDLLILVVDNNICKLYFENELIKEIDGSSIDGFVSWYSKLSVGILGSYNYGYLTQLAIYNKALSEVEIAEMQAYLKTLEVA